MQTGLESSTEAVSVAPAESGDGARGRLLRAAVEIFNRKGYAATSVREICEHAGLTKPALYYHFGSKEGVLTAILEAAASQFSSAVMQALDGPGGAADRLERLCQAVYELSSRHVPVVRVAHAAYFGPPEGTPAFDFARFDRALTGAIERIVQDGLASGELRQAPVREMSLAILGVIAACLRRPQPTGSDVVRRVVNLVFEGVMNRPAPREQLSLEE